MAIVADLHNPGLRDLELRSIGALGEPETVRSQTRARFDRDPLADPGVLPDVTR
jgi:hypothetical protein